MSWLPVKKWISTPRSVSSDRVQQPGETFRDDAPVFVPEIEQISYEEDGFGIGGNPPQPSDEQFFAFPRLLRR